MIDILNFTLSKRKYNKKITLLRQKPVKEHQVKCYVQVKNIVVTTSFNANPELTKSYFKSWAKAF